MGCGKFLASKNEKIPHKVSWKQEAYDVAMEAGFVTYLDLAIKSWRGDKRSFLIFLNKSKDLDLDNAALESHLARIYKIKEKWGPKKFNTFSKKLPKKIRDKLIKDLIFYDEVWLSQESQIIPIIE